MLHVPCRANNEAALSTASDGSACWGLAYRAASGACLLSCTPSVLRRTPIRPQTMLAATKGRTRRLLGELAIQRKHGGLDGVGHGGGRRGVALGAAGRGPLLAHALQRGADALAHLLAHLGVRRARLALQRRPRARRRVRRPPRLAACARRGRVQAPACRLQAKRW
jgi:hypothetical protein